ncbi:hypothetical protein [Citrobacter braakii]|uniref:hypothetical protein n=1 Tax=Citrobacter braakii TaxID=57706 RepID=UPI00397CCF53
MTTNHPAHGPVSLDRLHHIREILSKTAAQSDGGNLGYAIADAVKVIDVAIAAFRDDKETTHNSIIAEQLAHVLSSLDVNDHQRSIITCSVDRLNKNAEILQQAPYSLQVPQKLDYQGAKELFNYLMTEEETNATVNGWNACRAAMLQAGNSPVTPDCWCRTCRPVTMIDMRFVVCPDCGNKRCPHANDHRNACTGSNEPGQIGSAYPAAPQQEVKNG